MRFSILITDDQGADHMFDSEIDSRSADRVKDAIDGCRHMVMPGEILQTLARAILTITDMVDMKTYIMAPSYSGSPAGPMPPLSEPDKEAAHGSLEN